MKDLQIKKLNLLNETVNYYNDNERSVTKAEEGYETGCVYYRSDGNKCAAGRLFTDEAINYILHHGLNNTGFRKLIVERKEDDFPQLFKDEYQWLNKEIGFVNAIQDIHDSQQYWGDDGKLSGLGKKVAQDTEKAIKEERL